jgi:hypothetical protein
MGCQICNEQSTRVSLPVELIQRVEYEMD